MCAYMYIYNVHVYWTTSTFNTYIGPYDEWLFTTKEDSLNMYMYMHVYIQWNHSYPDSLGTGRHRELGKHGRTGETLKTGDRYT